MKEDAIIMGETPAVSVIIPAYNVEKYIAQSVQSVLSQNFKDFELIIINDGSKDSTPVLLDNIKDSDNRIIVIHTQNRGVSSARNKGLEIAKGEYITFLDGDDYWAPDYLSYMIGMANSTGADMCISTICYTAEKENQTKEEKIEVLTAEDATCLLLSPKVFVGCWNKLYQDKT